MSSSPNSSSSFDLGSPELRALHDVSCSVDIVLGTGSITVRECLNLTKHTILRLIQTAGSDLHVMVNGIELAHGEVVIVDDSTAIRVTEITPPSSVEDRP